MQAMTDEQAKAAIAKRLKSLLEERDLTASDLARMAGENPMYISRLLRQVISPTAGPLSRIAKALDVTIDDLFGLAEKTPSAA